MKKPGCVVALLGLLIAGCATPPAPPATEPPPAPVEAAPPAPACPVCDDGSVEIARLRQELANREAELRDLRAQQREQARALQETAKEATRAKVKLRRLATQADAASYLAEVEVAVETVRLPAEAPAAAPLVALAREILAASATPFAQGDYGGAMDLAAQAEQLVVVAGNARAGKGARPPPEAPFDVAIRLRTTQGGNLRRQPNGKSAAVGALPAGSPVVAHAWQGGWLRIETEDGRAGWMFQSLVTAR
jgi:hypothetical protein